MKWDPLAKAMWTVDPISGSIVDLSLTKFADAAAENGFKHVTRIFHAIVPVIKLVDKETDIEIDICVNNKLGVRNSYLLLCYCFFG